jgi:tetratricopeptide (TPR) repeat protein
MTLRLLSISIPFLFFANNLFSQETEVSVNILANDKIAEVNIDQEKFINGIVKITDYLKDHFKTLSKDQKIGILMITHKTENPTYSCYSSPKMDQSEMGKIVKELSSIKVENTKIVDFPIFFTVNTQADNLTIFEDFVNPIDQKRKDYETADLKTKLQMNKDYAINEVLPVLAAYEIMVDPQFQGVQNLGKLVKKTDFNQPQNMMSLLNVNTNYWRAGLEMGVGNQIIPVTKIFILVSQGDLDYAKEFVDIVRMFSSSKTRANDYLEEINWRLRLFHQQLNTEVAKGVDLHDQGKYDEALTIYNGLLKEYPHSSHALYEQYFSNNEKQLMEKKIEIGNTDNWFKVREEVYKYNPLYGVDVKATNGKEMYLIGRRQEIQTLFQKKEDKLKDVYKYAEIAQDLGVYDFAAQLFWFSVTLDKENMDKALNNYLYCLNKLGETEIKSNFKIDCDKVFKKIEKEKQAEMESSSLYQLMAK